MKNAAIFYEKKKKEEEIIYNPTIQNKKQS